jgi:indolepyruvate ferredoxin oxidoreductase beta subunit
MAFTQNPAPKTQNPSKSLRIFLTGVGGQGTLLASRLLGEAALAAGYNPMVSETHGMAQRGGIVVSTVVLGDLQSPLISPGEADIVLGFQRLAAQVGALLAFDAGALAREAGSPLAVNMVLLGALAATESLPITAQDILSVIHTRTKEKFLASNLKAFELGAAAARDPGNWQRR